jgi:hypothetical protein
VVGGRRVGLLAGMIYAVLPLATFHERQALVDPMMTAATTFSMVVTFHLVRRPRWWHGVLLTLALAVARLTKPAMLPFLILPLVAFALFIWPQRRPSDLLKALGMWAAAVAITLGAAELVYVLAARAGVFPRETLQVSLANTVLEKLQDPAVIERILGDLGVLAEIHVLYVGWLILALAALACLWAILAPRKRWRETLYLLIPGLLFAAMPLLATRPTRTGEIASRYLLLDASALVTLAALGLSLTLERLPKQVTRWALPVLVAALLVFPLPTQPALHPLRPARVRRRILDQQLPGTGGRDQRRLDRPDHPGLPAQLRFPHQEAGALPRGGAERAVAAHPGKGQPLTRRPRPLAKPVC